jgi:hypothetical protein
VANIVCVCVCVCVCFLTLCAWVCAEQGDSCGTVRVSEVDKRVAIVDTKRVDVMWQTLQENLEEMAERREREKLAATDAA